MVDKFKVGDRVAFYHADGWKTGTVTERMQYFGDWNITADDTGWNFGRWESEMLPIGARQFTIPARFWDDHASSNENPGRVLKYTSGGRYVTVELDDEQLANLRSDADLYATGKDDFWAEYRGLVLSARATLKALDKQMEDQK